MDSSSILDSMVWTLMGHFKTQKYQNQWYVCLNISFYVTVRKLNAFTDFEFAEDFLLNSQRHDLKTYPFACSDLQIFKRRSQFSFFCPSTIKWSFRVFFRFYLCFSRLVFTKTYPSSISNISDASYATVSLKLPPSAYFLPVFYNTRAK